MLIIQRIKKSNIIKNSGWLITQNIFTMLTGVFCTAVVARYFGAEKYGTFNYVYSIICLFSGIAPFGMHHIVVKDLTQKPKEEGKILGTCFLLRLIITLILLVISNITVYILSKYNTTMTIIGVLISSTMIFNLSEMVDYYSRANLKAKYISICKSISSLVLVGLKILVVVLEKDLIYYTATYVIEAIIYALLLVYSYKKMKHNEQQYKWSFNKSYAKQLLSKSWYFALSGIMVTIYLRIDQVMLGYMIDNKSNVGIYAAAVKIAEMWSFVPLAVINSYKPIIIKEKLISEIKYKLKLKKLYNLSWIVCLIFLIGIVLFGKYAVLILYGNEFIQASKIMNILIFGTCFGILGNIHYIWMVSENRGKYSLFYSLSGCLVNIILNLILIPKNGIYGAAIATLASQIVSNVIIFMFKRDTRQLSINMLKAIFLIDCLYVVKNKLSLNMKKGEK